MLLISSPVLALPKDDGDFIIDTDASEALVGAVLSQIQVGEERAMVYFSGLYSSTEVNYCTTRKGLLAVVEALQQFRPYALERHFRVRTDHAALRWSQRASNLVKQQVRWLDLLLNSISRKNIGLAINTGMPMPCRAEAVARACSPGTQGIRVYGYVHQLRNTT